MTRSNLQHEHDFAPESIDVFVDETVHVMWNCDFVEITDSQHSQRHDEIFYNEGASCATTKNASYEVTLYRGDWGELRTDDVIAEELTEVENEEAYYEMDKHLSDDKDVLIEEFAQMQPTGRIDEQVVFSIVMDCVDNKYVNGGTFTVVLDKTDEYVDEDWC